MDSESLVRSTQAVGIGSSFIMAGIYFGTSQLAIHPLYPLPTDQMARIFSELYHGGAGVMVPLAAASTIAYGASAYFARESRTEYAVAGVSIASTIGFTVAVMMPGIQKLLKVAEAGERAGISRDEVLRLVMAWRTQNFIRAALSLAGGVLGVFAFTRKP